MPLMNFTKSIFIESILSHFSRIKTACTVRVHERYTQDFFFAGKSALVYHIHMLRYCYYTFLSLLLLFVSQAVFALEKLGPPTTPDGGSVYGFVRVVLGIIIKIAIPALVVIIVFFAFQIVVAQGDEKTLTEAKHRFKIVLIVAAIFLGLGLIAAIIYNTGSSVGYVELFPADSAPIDSKFDAVMHSTLFK